MPAGRPDRELRGKVAIIGGAITEVGRVPARSPLALATAAGPTPDADTAELWAGLRRGVLLLQHCSGCSAVHYYQQPRCRVCGSEHLEHRAASGRGTVHAFSIVHRAPGPAFRDDTPYAVLLVELPEGPRMISRLVGGGIDALRIGAAVELDCVAVSDEISLPFFRLA